ncbi:hypothetical protein ACFL3C_00005 [Patescibacteria group bacterium]
MFNRSILKKGMLLATLIIFPLFASSCTWFGGGDGDLQTNEMVQEKRSGVLRSLGGMSIGDGTHLLEMSDGTTLRLRSLNIDLDQEKYLSKKVEVRGPITTASDGKDLMEVTSIDLSEDEEDEGQVEKGRETEYKNADLGFKLTYMDSWKVEEDEGNVTFTSPVVKKEVKDDEDADEEEEVMTAPAEDEQDMVIITKLGNPQKKSIEAFLSLPEDPNELITLGYVQTTIGTDQLEGLKKQSADLQAIDLYLTRDEAVYHLSFVGTDNQNMITNRNTFFSMVASFQFIGMATEDDEEDDVETKLITESDNPVFEDDVANNPTEDIYVEPEETKPETDIAEVPESKPEPTVSSSSYGLIAQYISETIDSIAPESSDAGSWSTNSFEFVEPNYVYTVYSDGSETRRVLLTYEQSGTQFETDVVGYFEPGETTSWERVSGDNPVATSEKTVITIGDEGAQEAAVVKEGYRYFESLPYDFQAQYPTNWYFSGYSGSGDVSHHYGFSDDPVEDGNELVSVDIVSGSLPSGSPISVGAHSGVKVYSGDNVAIYIEREDGKLYKVHGSTGYESYIIDIAASIEAN